MELPVKCKYPLNTADIPEECVLYPSSDMFPASSSSSPTTTTFLPPISLSSLAETSSMCSTAFRAWTTLDPTVVGGGSPWISCWVAELVGVYWSGCHVTTGGGWYTSPSDVATVAFELLSI